jgi:hypothetical protein
MKLIMGIWDSDEVEYWRCNVRPEIPIHEFNDRLMRSFANIFSRLNRYSLGEMAGGAESLAMYLKSTMMNVRCLKRQLQAVGLKCWEALLA